VIKRREFLAFAASSLVTSCAGPQSEFPEPPLPAPEQMMPIISALVFTQTDSTIAATWTTDTSADSNIFAGSKAGIDNGVAANSVSHAAIVAGLLPGTIYSCYVVSGGTSSTPQNVTTASPLGRTPITIAMLSAAQTTGTAPEGDSLYTFVSSDNKEYITQNDGYGFVASTPNAGANMQLGVLSNEATFVGTLSNLLTNYGPWSTANGTDGPGSTPLSNKIVGIFGLGGRLFLSLTRGKLDGTWQGYGNIIADNGDHGATWNNYQAPSTFSANGSPINTSSGSQFPFWYASPIRYAADDGTLGYNTAGNQIDGANAYVYMVFNETGLTQTCYLMRQSRILFNALSTTVEYWGGPSSPTPLDFTNDSNWTSTYASKTAIINRQLNSGNLFVTFIPTINRYLATGWTWLAGTTSSTAFTFWEGPTPAGPWTQVMHTAYNPKGYYAPFPAHRSVISNVALDNIQIPVVFTGDYAFAATYVPTRATVTLSTSRPAMIQLATYAFTTVENPLSDGGNFTVCPAYNNLQVASSGVCEATATSTNCLMYWSGASPASWPNDQYSEFTIGQIGTTLNDAFYGVVRQSTSAQTLYLLVLLPSVGFSTLYAFVAGTGHLLNQKILTPATSDVWRFSVTGNVLTVTQNGTSVWTFTDANNYVTAGSPGIGILAPVLANDTIILWAGGGVLPSGSGDLGPGYDFKFRL